MGLPTDQSGHGEKLMALAALVTALASLVAAIRGQQQQRRARRRTDRIEQRLKTHVTRRENPLDSDAKPDRIK